MNPSEVTLTAQTKIFVNGQRLPFSSLDIHSAPKDVLRYTITGVIKKGALTVGEDGEITLELKAYGPA